MFSATMVVTLKVCPGTALHCIILTVNIFSWKNLALHFIIRLHLLSFTLHYIKILKGKGAKNRKNWPKNRKWPTARNGEKMTQKRVFVRESFYESEEGVRLPRERLTSGEVRGTSGEVRGTSGEVWESSGEPLDCYSVPQWENFRGSRRKLPGKFGKLPGMSGDFPESRSSGEPDSLPVTRQICLQFWAILEPCFSPYQALVPLLRGWRPWKWQWVFAPTTGSPLSQNFHPRPGRRQKSLLRNSGVGGWGVKIWSSS